MLEHVVHSVEARDAGEDLLGAAHLRGVRIDHGRELCARATAVRTGMRGRSDSLGIGLHCDADPAAADHGRTISSPSHAGISR